MFKYELGFKVKIDEFIGTYITGVSKKKEIVLLPTGGGAGKGRNWMGRGRGRIGVGWRGIDEFSSVFLFFYLNLLWS